MIIIDFIKTYWLDILIGIGLVIGLVYMYVEGNKSFVRGIVLDLVREAELMLGEKTGELKYAYVVNKIYERLPKILTLFLTQSYINRLIEEGVYILKDYLDNGLLDNSYVIVQED